MQPTLSEVDELLRPCTDELLSLAGIVAHASYDPNNGNPRILLEGHYLSKSRHDVDSYVPRIKKLVPYAYRNYSVVSSFCEVGDCD